MKVVDYIFRLIMYSLFSIFTFDLFILLALALKTRFGAPFDDVWKTAITGCVLFSMAICWSVPTK